MENRASVVQEITRFVTTHYAGNWQNAFNAYAVNGTIDHSTVVKILEDAGVGTLLGRPFIASEVMQVFDADSDGKITYAEFQQIAHIPTSETS